MQITHQGTMMTGGNNEIRGITAMEVMQIGGEIMLYAHSVGAGGTMSGLQVFSDAGGAFTAEGAASGSYNFNASQGVPTGMICVTIDGVDQLLMSGSANGDVAGFDIGSGGQLSAMDTVSLAQGPGGSVEAMATVTINGQDYIFASHDGSDGVWGYVQGANGEFTQSYQSAANTQGNAFVAALEGDVTAITVASVGGENFLATASRSDNSVTLWSVDETGELAPLAQIGADTGLGLHEPVALQTVEVGGDTFIIAAGAGSSSVSVLELRPNGVLMATDHVIDGLSTRFQNITEMEAVTVGDQVFLFVAGADDGISVFSVLPGGRLLHRSTIADSEATSLDAVSSLVVVEEGGSMVIFASSGTEAGISRFEFAPDVGGGLQQGSDANDALTGTGQGDILYGGAGADTLIGGGGDDILMDGTGQDLMRGGGGADVFVFEADGEVDHVMDYNWQQDRLDLSGLGMIYDMSQIEIIPTANGATLIFGDERIEVVSHDGTSLTANNFSNATLLDVQHTPVTNVVADISVTGTAGDDTLRGQAGDDLLEGGAGADDYDGRAGFDTVSYASAASRVILDLDDLSRNISDAEGDTFTRIEGFEGSSHRDHMLGADENDVFSGGGGGDFFRGRAGDDRIDGGMGNDRIFGDHGADVLSGGDDTHRDTFVYASEAHSRPGAGARDIITDFEPDEDMIDLRQIDPDASQNGNQSFTYVGQSAFSGSVGELRYEVGTDMTLVQADLDGDGVADMEIELRGVNDLSEGDFFL